MSFSISKGLDVISINILIHFAEPNLLDVLTKTARSVLGIVSNFDEPTGTQELVRVSSTYHRNKIKCLTAALITTKRLQNHCISRELQTEKVSPGKMCCICEQLRSTKKMLKNEVASLNFFLKTNFHRSLFVLSLEFGLPLQRFFVLSA